MQQPVFFLPAELYTGILDDICVCLNIFIIQSKSPTKNRLPLKRGLTHLHAVTDDVASTQILVGWHLKEYRFQFRIVGLPEMPRR